MRYLYLFFILLACSKDDISNLKWQNLSSGHASSVRALAAVDESVIWFAGTKGIVGYSMDAGMSFIIDSVPNSRNVDFRDIEAFDKNTVIIMGAGNGRDSKLLKTENAGKSWDLLFQNTDSLVFFDGIAFWNQQSGILLGDPINAKAYIRVTEDAGKTWKEPASLPPFLEGEYAFAASGSSIVTQGDSNVYIVSGGKYARVFKSENRGRTWLVMGPDFIAGKNSQGIFSIDLLENMIAIVGGDYQEDSLVYKNLFISVDNGNNWLENLNKNTAYQSCVKIHPLEKIIVSVGTSGSYWSHDLGNTWEKFSSEKLHVLAFSPKGKSLYAAGSKGLMLKIDFN
jgi:photosystem II stability/assembly factor-like uncharacterized protein